MSDNAKSWLVAVGASLVWLSLYVGAHVWFHWRAGAL